MTASPAEAGDDAPPGAADASPNVFSRRGAPARAGDDALPGAADAPSNVFSRRGAPTGAADAPPVAPPAGVLEDEAAPNKSSSSSTPSGADALPAADNDQGESFNVGLDEEVHDAASEWWWSQGLVDQGDSD